jgi:hypothetical protein
MKRIGFNENFWLYVYLNHKLAPVLTEALGERKFVCKVKDMDEDHEVKILVTPGNASEAHAIIRSIVYP